METKTNWQYNEVVRESDLNRIEGNIKKLNEQTKESATLTRTLSQGLEIIDADQPSPASVVVLGQTRYNLLGSDGGCESLAPFNTSFGTVEVSTTERRSGNASFKVSANNNAARAERDYTYQLDPSKQYIVAGWVFVEQYSSGASPSIILRDVGTNNTRYVASAVASKVGSWQFVYVKIPNANTLVGSGFRLVIGAGSSGTTFTAYFDEIRIIEVEPALYNAIGTEINGEDVDRVIPYIDGMQSVQGLAITHKGPNQVPPLHSTAINVHAGVTSELLGPYALRIKAPSASAGLSYIFISVVPNRQYTFASDISGAGAIGVYSADANTILAAYATTPRTFNSGSNTTIRLYFRADANTQADFINPMLVLGDASALPPSFVAQEDQDHRADVTLNRVGSVADIYDASKGEKWKALGEVRLSDLVFSSVETGLTNVDRIRYARPTNMSTANARELIAVEGMAEQVSGSVDNASNAGRYSTTQSTTFIEFLVPKGTTRTQFEAATNMSAKIIYRLANPDWEPVPHNGALTVHPGSNIVEIRTGLVWKERANPTLVFGDYRINTTTANKTGHRIDQLLGIYRGPNKDGDWTIRTRTNQAEIDAYGNQWASIPPTDYDATKDYSVDFIVLDRHAYTTSVSEAMIVYGANIGTVVGELVEQLARVMTQIDGIQWTQTEDGAHIDNLRVDVDAHVADTTSHELWLGLKTVVSNVIRLDLTADQRSRIVYGSRLSFEVNAAATTPTIRLDSASSTTIPVLRPNGLPARMAAGGIYTVVRGTSAFILAGEGGEYGDAAAGDVLAGKTIGTEEGLVTGTLALTGNATAAQVLVDRTYYDTDAKTIRTGTNPNRTGHVTAQSVSRSGTTIRLRPPQGNYPGDAANSVQIADPDFIAANIRDGVDIFGQIGSLVPGRLEATGGGSPQVFGEFTVTGLAFRPAFIIINTTINFGGNLGVSQLLYSGGGTANLYAAYPNNGSSTERTQYDANRWTINDDGFVVRGVTQHVSWRAFGPVQT